MSMIYVLRKSFSIVPHFFLHHLLIPLPTPEAHDAFSNDPYFLTHKMKINTDMFIFITRRNTYNKKFYHFNYQQKQSRFKGNKKIKNFFTCNLSSLFAHFNSRNMTITRSHQVQSCILL